MWSFPVSKASKLGQIYIKCSPQAESNKACALFNSSHALEILRESIRTLHLCVKIEKIRMFKDPFLLFILKQYIMMTK